MTLRDYIITNDLASATPADVIAGLTETVEISRNSERWLLTGIGYLIGRDAMLGLLAALEASPQTKPFVYILTAGIFLDDPQTREAIAGLQAAGIVSAETAAALLDAGIKYGPAWRKAGLDALPSEADVAAAQETIASEQLREAVAARYQAVRAAVDAGEILTWDAARTAMGAE